MLTKIKTFLKAIFSVHGCDRNWDEFSVSINKINVSRGKSTSLMFVFLEGMLIAAAVLFKKGNAFKVPGVYYTVMYFVLLFAMLVFYFIFSKLEKDIAGYITKINIAGIVFACFILCWCAGISILDELLSGQIMVYVFAVIAIAVTPFYKPNVLLFLYFPVQIAFVLFLIVFSRTGIPFGDIINSTTFVIISWIISLMRYRRQVVEFNNQKLIEEKNRELKQMNAQLQKVNQRLEELSRIDGLTGIFNRSMFDFSIKSEWYRCKREIKPLSLLMIDIDFFKEFNDHYGHPSGDDCIRQITGALSACAKRASDTVARYGGEEFAVILPYTGRRHAEMLAQQIREKVEKLAIPHAYSTISCYVTISVGVYSACPANDIPVEKFIENADVALYVAKRYRNHVTVSNLALE